MMTKFQMPVIAAATQDDPTIDELNAELRENSLVNEFDEIADDFLDLDGELADAIEAMMLAEDAAFMAGTLEPIDMSGWTMTTTKIIGPYFAEPVETKLYLPAIDVPGTVRFVNDENASYMFRDGKWIVFSMIATKPDRAPPRMLTDTCDGVHPPRSMDYFRRFADAPTTAEELKMWASIGVSGSVLREWADVYPIEDPMVFKVPKGLRDQQLPAIKSIMYFPDLPTPTAEDFSIINRIGRDRSEYCTDVPRKHSAGPNPCGEVTLMSSRPCTLSHINMNVDLSQTFKPLTLDDIGVQPKKRKILVSR